MDNKTNLLPLSIAPIGLTEEQAAAYLGLELQTFRNCVEFKVLPDALEIPHGRRKVYYRKQLDEAYDRLAKLPPETGDALMAAIMHD